MAHSRENEPKSVWEFRLGLNLTSTGKTKRGRGGMLHINCTSQLFFPNYQRAVMPSSVNVESNVSICQVLDHGRREIHLWEGGEHETPAPGGRVAMSTVLWKSGVCRIVTFQRFSFLHRSCLCFLQQVEGSVEMVTTEGTVK